ncbi:malate dehydrogenase (quinone) [Pseudaeromonas sp. ZJS20]|uniref:malate dehydrogenase (quinone) n=1 Tax=Pseudaeromonas aegiceratis TaxID=3153928 RepID=UPI00390C6CDA
MASLQADVTLVGGGIMSATLAMLLHRLDPSLHICMIEQLADVAQESSAALHNAGTGHAGYCELNYTPQGPGGQVAINRAIEINTAFDLSLQFWSHLVTSEAEIDPKAFINRVPHMSAVWGQANVAFLRARYEKMHAHHLFDTMQWSQDPAQLAQWMPLLLAGRDPAMPLAATRVEQGADVNFGALTGILVQYLQRHAPFTLLTQTRVSGFKRLGGNGQPWRVKAVNRASGETCQVESPFVFLGAGGNALRLLQKSGIPEAAGYGGFPVSGQWLICQNPALMAQHHAKVYSLAPVGAPPMSVPHLDTRIIGGESCLLFGPYAGFTTRFLNQGSRLDLIKSVRPNNLKSLLGAGSSNLELTRYLMKEAVQTHSQRIAALASFLPQAKANEWKLAHAGKRVQVIKRDEGRWGKLEFGTELVASADGSLAALLGASPGASVSVKAMLDLLARCFPRQLQGAQWQERLKQMVPSYGQDLSQNAALAARVHDYTRGVLGLLP